MTPIEIAYFKHFMFDKDLVRSYQHLYKTRNIKGGPRGDKEANPESIEEYFLKTTREDVIMKAFYFAPTNNNAQRITVTYDYWKDIDDKWQTYMKDNESNYSNDNWPSLRKTFSILRQNWDLPNYWKRENYESTEEVYKRMHIELPLPDFVWEHGFTPPSTVRKDTELIATNIFNAKDGDVLVRVRKGEDYVHRLILLFWKLEPFVTDDGDKLHKACYYAIFDTYEHRLKIPENKQGYILVTNNPDISFRLAFDEEKNILMKKIEERGMKWDEESKELIPIEDEETDPPLVEFTDEEDDPLADFDFLDGVLPGNYRLKQNEASLNFYKSNKITFNRLDSKELKKHGFKFARLAKSKSGEICLIFNNLKGANVTNIKCGRDNTNVTVNSADICGKIKLLFSLKDTYSILRVEKIQETQEFIIYKITKKNEH